MKKIFGILLICTGLFGCWATNNIIHGPDGQDMIAIRCGGSWADQTTCLMKAEEICPYGYTIIEQSGGTEIVSIQYGTNSIRTYRGNMLINCKLYEDMFPTYGK